MANFLQFLQKSVESVERAGDFVSESETMARSLSLRLLPSPSPDEKNALERFEKGQALIRFVLKKTVGDFRISEGQQEPKKKWTELDQKGFEVEKRKFQS